jgi:hypothetical protein
MTKQNILLKTNSNKILFKGKYHRNIFETIDTYDIIVIIIISISPSIPILITLDPSIPLISKIIADIIYSGMFLFIIYFFFVYLRRYKTPRRIEMLQDRIHLTPSSANKPKVGRKHKIWYSNINNIELVSEKAIFHLKDQPEQSFDIDAMPDTDLTKMLKILNSKNVEIFDRRAKYHHKDK